MGMSVGSNPNAEPAILIEMNTTPLIDVMLVLLVMLIITIPVQKHAVKLDMPVDQNTPPPPPDQIIEPIDMEVDFDGTLYWNGVVVNGQGDLQNRLLQTARMEPQPEFHIRPNRLAAYKHVINVMATAQRLGVTKIGMVGGPTS